MTTFPLSLGAELVTAKAVDYVGANVMRSAGSPNEAFYANMARLGLQNGFDATEKALPWWYGAVSAGMTGSTDFIAGQVLGGLLRMQVVAALEAHPDVKRAVGGAIPPFDQLLLALRGESIPGATEARAQGLARLAELVVNDGGGDGALLKKLMEDAGEVELKAPVTRHLKKALTDPGASEFAGFVERSLLSERPLKGGALGGTIVGHAVAGGATGLVTGHPAAGAFVTLLDSLTEGMLAKKAIAGKYESLTTMKCAMLLQGIREAEHAPDWRQRLGNGVLAAYSQMGEEVRLFGEDLYRLAAAADVIGTDALPALSADVAAVVGDGIATIAPHHTAEHPATVLARGAVTGYAKEQAAQAVTSAGGSISEIVRAQVKVARDEIEHHASAGMGQALARDFAEEGAALQAELEKWREAGRQLAAEIFEIHPEMKTMLEAHAHRQRGSSDPLARVLDAARRLLKRMARLAHGAVAQVKRTGDDAVKSALETREAQALGKSILALADFMEEHVKPGVVMTGIEAQDAARAAAFTLLSVSGTVFVKTVIAGEHVVEHNAEALERLDDRRKAAADKVIGATLVAAQRIKQSASAGASALLGLVIRAAIIMAPEMPPPPPPPLDTE